MEFKTLNVALVAEGSWESLVENLSTEIAWDMVALQEFTTAREAGMRIINGHLLLISGAESRKCTALLIFR